jgi:hypothetical protein
VIANGSAPVGREYVGQIDSYGLLFYSDFIQNVEQHKYNRIIDIGNT